MSLGGYTAARLLHVSLYRLKMSLRKLLSTAGPNQRQRRFSRTLGIAVWIVGPVLFVGAIPFLFGRSELSWQFVIVFGISSGLSLLGSKIKQLTAFELLERDLRPPLVYLRNFSRDSIDSYDVGFSDRFARGPQFGPLIAIYFALGLYRSRFEPILTLALRPLGPLIAIGRPGEVIPAEGAARLYVSDADWQTLITTALREARVVIWQAGTTEHVLWELRQAIATVKPTRLLLLFPRRRGQIQHDCLSAVNGILPKPLIDVSSKFQFVGFDLTWGPVLINADPPPRSLTENFVLSVQPQHLALRRAMSHHFRDLAREGEEVIAASP